MEQENNELEAFKARSEARAEAQAPANEGSGATSSDDYAKRMINAFVAKPDAPDKEFWYQNAFAKYNINGVDAMKWNWSWWAFFGGIWFLIYRKAYAAAGGLFLISIAAAFIPFAGLIIWILSGGYSTYFVYKTFKTKKLEIEAAQSDENQRIETMRMVGGYNQWVVILAVVINVSVAIGMFMAVAAMFAAGSGNY